MKTKQQVHVTKIVVSGAKVKISEHLEQEKAKRFVLRRGDADYDHLLGCVEQCWQAVGPDYMTGCEEMRQRMVNSHAIETCLDANRLAMYPGGENGKRADAFVHEVAKQGRFRSLVRAVSRDLKFV